VCIGCNIVEQRWSVENKKLAMHLGSAINPEAAQWSPDHQDVDMGR